MLEKFDDHRLRLKRPVEARQRDATLPEGIDPYRTQYGTLDNQTALVIVAVTSALFLAAGLLVFLFFEDTPAWPGAAVGGALFIGLMGLAIARLRGAAG